MYNVQTLLNDLASVIHGTTINKVPNVYGHINRAARAVLLDVDPKETQRILQLSQVFNSVYDYAAPPDVKGDRFIDVRPQAGRQPWEVFFQGYETDFDVDKSWTFENKIYTQWNTGVKTMRINAPFLTSPVTLTDTSSVTGWTLSGGASTLTLDQTNNVAGGGALTFNLLAGQSTGSIQNLALFPVDYTNYLNTSTGFVWVYLPTGASVTAIQAKWGTDASNYYTYTATVTQQGTAFQNGWNLIAFPWVSASVVGSPTITNTKFTAFSFTYNSALQTGVKVCNFTFGLGYIFEAVYYSKYLFRDTSTNGFIESLTDSTDNNKLINLDTDSYNLLFNKTAYYVSQALQGADAAYDAMFFGGQDGMGGEYGNALKKYKALNPSEAMVKGSTYYRPSNKSYSRFSTWFGRNP